MTENRWEDISCPICIDSGPEIEPYAVCSDRLTDPKLYKYRLVKCTGCGLIFLNPRPVSSLTKDVYKSDDYDPFLSAKSKKSFYSTAYNLARSLMLKRKESIIKMVHSGSGTLLDIGCGTGEFLAFMSKKFQVEGVETDEAAAEYARKKHSLTIYNSDLIKAGLNDLEYDVITMWHVLEHVPNPIEVLEHINNKLRSGGHLILGLPNISSLDARIYGKHWVAIDAPRHLWHFNSLQIQSLINQCGFKLVKQGMLPFDLFYNVLHSEKNLWLVDGLPKRIFAPVTMTIYTLLSFLHGVLFNNYSSKYYILRRL